MYIFIIMVMAMTNSIAAQWHLDEDIEKQLRATLADSIACGKYLKDSANNSCLLCTQAMHQQLEALPQGNLLEQESIKPLVEQAQKLWNLLLHDPVCAATYKQAQELNTPQAWSELQKLYARTAAVVLHNKTSLQFPSLQGRDYTNVPDYVRKTEFLAANANMHVEDYQAYQSGIIFLFYLKQLQKNAKNSTINPST